MTVTLVVTIAGIVLIGAAGFYGRRNPSQDLAEWTVGGRRFGAVTMWFLQAGEVFTTFTFLGMAGLAFTGGVAALYAMPYVPLGYIGLYFLAPRVWRLGKDRDYLTQADFLADRYGSRRLGTLSAVLGVVFLLPYLQLQITGIGLIVRLVTGDAASGTWSMVLGTVLTVAFVLWSGIRGVATASYLKDFLMIVTLAALVVVVPVAVAGGIPDMFGEIARTQPEKLTVEWAGEFGKSFFFTSMLASAIGVLFLTLPHQWPMVLSARNPDVLRKNYTYLPLYQIAIAFPMVIGLAAVLIADSLPSHAVSNEGNGILLALSARTLPDWMVGVIAVAGAATAMVPAAGIVIGMSSLITRNIVRTGSERTKVRINHVTVVVACVLALGLGLARPDLLANLLLLTFSGLDQLAPAIALGLLGRRLVGVVPVVCGIAVGEAVVVWATFTDVNLMHINEGIVGLAANIVTVAVAAFVERGLGRSPAGPAGSAGPEARSEVPAAD